MKKHILVALVIAAATGLALAQTPMQKSVPASANATVSIENVAGKVTVSGWDRNEVEVKAMLGKEVEDLKVTGTGDSISIEVELPEGSHSHHDDMDVDMTIRVPRGARLEVETVSASVDCSDLIGDLDLESVSGEVTLKGTPRSVELATVSGNAVVETTGELKSGKFESVSGSIDVRADLNPNGRFEFETVSGSLKLHLPRSVAAEFKISTFSGNIKNDIGPEAASTSKHLPSKELNFSTGSGGARVSMESLSGSIELLSD